MSGLTTHILDTSRGLPVDGINLILYRLNGDNLELICKRVSNSDGRTDKPLLEDNDMKPGVYRIDFEIGAYFSEDFEETFLDVIPIQFRILDTNSHYHVPLLVSPFGYSTYRGS